MKWTDFEILNDGEHCYMMLGNEPFSPLYELYQASTCVNFLGYVYEMPWGDTIIHGSAVLWINEDKRTFDAFEVDLGDADEPIRPVAVRWRRE